jgi:hypothetical protein
MKKTILGFLLAACAIYSCSKNQNDNNPAVSTVKRPSISNKTDSYYSSALSPTSDPNVYSGMYNGITFLASSLTYDKVAYPNNVNGVPVMGILTVPNNDAIITQTYVQDGSSYIVFTQPKPAFKGDSLNSDLINFDDAFNQWVAEGAPYGQAPLITSYVKSSYLSGGGSVITTICKLIKCADGSSSYYAIADPSYPQPSPVISSGPTPPSAKSCEVEINGVYYDLWLETGTSGNIVSIADAYTGPPFNSISTTGWTVSGTYSNYNAQAGTVVISNLVIYKPGINNTVTYSGTGINGF